MVNQLKIKLFKLQKKKKREREKRNTPPEGDEALGKT